MWKGRRVNYAFSQPDALPAGQRWIAARASVALPAFTNPPGFGLAYSGPDGRPRLHAEFTE